MTLLRANHRAPKQPIRLVLVLAIVIAEASSFITTEPAGRSVRQPTTLAVETSANGFLPGVSCSGEQITVVGATGYIGKAVVKESVRRGYPTTAVVRPGSGADESAYHDSSMPSSSSKPTIRRFDVSDREACSRGQLFEPGSVDTVVCCLASRSGTPKEAFAIDYQASLNVARAAKQAGARRFVLLSAYCVKSAEQNDPHALRFQYAKKKLEVALSCMAEQSEDDDGAASSTDDDSAPGFSYVAVRPTAFFKSVSGQVETVQGGGPFIVFDLGEGKTAACNPIGEADLASALIDQVVDDAHKNTHWNLGGPDAAIGGLDKYDQAEMIYEVLGLEGEPRYVKIPIGVLRFVVDSFQWLANVFGSDKLNDAAELARIVRYYAIEDMLTTLPEEKYGTTTTKQHYEYIAKNGQDYDPYTSAYGILKDRKRILDESSKAVAANGSTTTIAAAASVAGAAAAAAVVAVEEVVAVEPR